MVSPYKCLIQIIKGDNMKHNKKNTKFTDIKYNPGRRKFIKRLGITAISVSAFSVVSLSSFSCSNSVSPVVNNPGGYRYFYY